MSIIEEDGKFEEDGKSKESESPRSSFVGSESDRSIFSRA
jgi:hypothetical protein